jgi:hypothetical protein
MLPLIVRLSYRKNPILSSASSTTAGELKILLQLTVLALFNLTGFVGRYQFDRPLLQLSFEPAVCLLLGILRKRLQSLCICDGSGQLRNLPVQDNDFLQQPYCRVLALVHGVPLNLGTTDNMGSNNGRCLRQARL